MCKVKIWYLILIVICLFQAKCWAEFRHNSTEHHGHDHFTHHLMQYTMNKSLDAFKHCNSVTLRKITFMDESFFVWEKSNTIGDTVDYVLNGQNGEKKVSNIFSKVLQGGACSKHSSCGIRNPIVLDIGANMGIYGLYAGMKGYQTYMFDVQKSCQRDIFAAITMNHLLGHTFVIPFAAGSEATTIEIDQSTHCYGVFRLSKGQQHEIYTKNDGQAKLKPLATQMYSLDSIFHQQLLQNKRFILLTKIDTEGYEYKVVSGMKNILKDGLIKHLIVEISPYLWTNYGFERRKVADLFSEALWDAGYQSVVAFGNFDEDDKVLHSRDELHSYISSGTFRQRDFHFERTISSII